MEGDEESTYHIKLCLLDKNYMIDYTVYSEYK